MHPTKAPKDHKKHDVLKDGRGDSVQSTVMKTTTRSWIFPADVQLEKEFDHLLRSTIPGTARKS